MIKMLNMVLLGILIVIGSAGKASAADSVNLSATVVARKPTDTMNDFNFSTINPAGMAQKTDMNGSVKGASTATNNDSSTQIIEFELGAVFLSVLFFYFMKFMKRKRHLLAMSEHKMVNNIA